jgi:hypothetical protein
MAGASAADVAGLSGWEAQRLFGKRRGDGVHRRGYRPDRRRPVPRRRLRGFAIPWLYGYLRQRRQLDRRRSFRAHTFDGALYASTIYHQLDPRQSLERARRVIRPRGKLYLWYEPERIDLRYTAWRIRQTLGWPCHYSKSLRWAFTRNSLRSMLKRTGFAVDEEVLLCVKCPAYPTCRKPAAFLVIAR